MSFLLMESDTHTLRRIGERHQEGMKIPKEDIAVITNEHFVVTSQSYRSVCYTVKKNIDECNCKLKCADCNSVCVHEYVCDCVDNAISSNFCKHIHAVLNFQNTEAEWFLNDDVNLNITVDVNPNYKYKEINEIYNKMQTRSLKNLQSEDDMNNAMTTLIHQILQRVQNVQLDDGELCTKALQYLKQTAKLIEMKQKEATTIKKKPRSPANKKFEPQLRFKSTKKYISNSRSV